MSPGCSDDDVSFDSLDTGGESSDVSSGISLENRHGALQDGEIRKRQYDPANRGKVIKAIDKAMKKNIRRYHRVMASKKRQVRAQAAYIITDSRGYVHCHGSKLLRDAVKASNLENKVIKSNGWFDKEIVNSNTLDESMACALPKLNKRGAKLSEMNGKETLRFIRSVMAALNDGMRPRYRNQQRPDFWPDQIDYVNPAAKKNFTGCGQIKTKTEILRYIIRHIYIYYNCYERLNDGDVPPLDHVHLDENRGRSPVHHNNWPNPQFDARGTSDRSDINHSRQPDGRGIAGVGDKQCRVPPAGISSDQRHRYHNDINGPSPLTTSNGQTPWGSELRAGHTIVIYYVDNEPTPYRILLPVPSDQVTLADFKKALPRLNFKFFFRSEDSCYGIVKDEISDNNALLPVSNGLVEASLITLHGHTYSAHVFGQCVDTADICQTRIRPVSNKAVSPNLVCRERPGSPSVNSVQFSICDGPTSMSSSPVLCETPLVATGPEALPSNPGCDSCGQTGHFTQERPNSRSDYVPAPGAEPSGNTFNSVHSASSFGGGVDNHDDQHEYPHTSNENAHHTSVPSVETSDGNLMGIGREMEVFVNEIMDGEMIVDDVIEAFFKLVKAAAPHVRGLLPPALLMVNESIEFDSANLRIQIHYVPGHWVVSSSCCSEDSRVIHLFDSKAVKSRKSTIINRADLRRQLALLYVDLKSEQDEIEVQYHVIPRQKGGKDCGFYAFAYVTALALGFDPAMLRFDQGKLREHTLKILLSGQLEMYPCTQIDAAPSFSFLLSVYCCFLQIPGSNWIQCAVCTNWFHVMCLRGELKLNAETAYKLGDAGVFICGCSC